MEKKKQKKNTRLTKNITPSKYSIKLHPDLENFTFSGEEVISLQLEKNAKKIKLHSKEIEIDTVSIEFTETVNKKKKKQKIFASKIEYNKEDETVSFIFKTSIPSGKAKLRISFKGILNDKMRGFYRSSYIWDDNVHHLATTQFESTDARRAFPCFDEPAFKSVFEVSLVVPKGKKAISNTLPVSTQVHESGFEVIRFSPTPKMSTYLLAFMVGDFEHIKKKTKRGVEVRVFTTRGKKHQAKFALSCAVKTLDFYEEYFDIKYPLANLDMIAIPDFAAGAMENWGAVTYRESALLVDSLHSSISNKKWVALVIAHELAHQWFGNLVTMEWWTHLWLNEGFASYIEYLAVDKMFPKWDIWTQFVTHDLGVALKLDSLYHTHPIEVKVHHPDEIGEIFDAVSYSKGASVIRMLADYLGEKDFRNGLRYYLKKHSYKNTETIHLWEAFEKISKKPVGKIMKNWTQKGGYPLISVSVDKENLVLKQQRFFSSAILKEKVLGSKGKASDDIKWQIPVTLGGKNKKEEVFFKNKKLEVPFSGKWVKINKGESGFFRVAYSGELLEKLKSPIYKKNLSTSDRLGVVRDLFALAEAGQVCTVDVINFLKAYEDESSYVVWLEIVSGLSKIRQLFGKTKTGEEIDNLTKNLLIPVFNHLGWEKSRREKTSVTLLRSLSLVSLSRAGYSKVLKDASKKFSKIKKGEKVDADIRSVIYSAVALSGGERELKSMIYLYKKETLHEEKNRIGYALGDFKDKEILKKVCGFAVSPSVRIQDSISILSSVGSNPYGRDVWMSFIKKNWSLLLERYGDGGYSLSRLVKAINKSAEKKHLKSFVKFFEENEAPGAKRAIEQVKESLRNNILWLERDKKEVIKYFKNIKK